MQAKPRKKKLETAALGFEHGKQVFVNEHLPQKNEKLLAAARQRRKKGNCKFIWTLGGRTFVRKDEGTGVIRIVTVEDLDKITAGEPFRNFPSSTAA